MDIFEQYDAGFELVRTSGLRRSAMWVGPNGTVIKEGPHLFRWHRHNVDAFDTQTPKTGRTDTWEIACLRAEQSEEVEIAA
jgi:hypothetical protein